MLVAATLKSSLVRLGTNRPPSYVDAAKRFAQAYDSYAKGAMATATGIPFTPTGAESSKFLSAILPAFSNQKGNPAAMASAFSTAIVAYWTGTFFGTGVVTPPVGAAVLQTALLGVFLNNQNPLDAAMQQIASALDACTRTTIVTFVYPPPAPPIVSPIS